MTAKLPWNELLAPFTIIAIVALWAWGAGFWMGTYFVPQASFEQLVQRVVQLEKLAFPLP